MAQVKQLGEEEKEAEEKEAEEKKRNFILMIVSVVLVVSESLLIMPLGKKR